MAIKYSNQAGLSITKLLEAPFAGKHPKPITKGTKAAAAEAAVTAAEAIAVADLEEAKRYQRALQPSALAPRARGRRRRAAPNRRDCAAFAALPFGTRLRNGS